MNLADVKQLSDQALNEWAGTWLGWIRLYECCQGWHKSSVIQPMPPDMIDEVWDPCQSFSQVHTYLLPKIKELGLESDFTKTLCGLLGSKKVQSESFGYKYIFDGEMWEVFSVLTTSPRQLLEAIVLTASAASSEGGKDG